jgi:spore cortex formation protein SpoVR/YcgB (stage V sporulation)
MTDEQAKQEIISVFSEAGKGIQYWMEHLGHSEIQKLLDATAIVKSAKQLALRRQQEKLR